MRFLCYFNSKAAFNISTRASIEKAFSLECVQLIARVSLKRVQLIDRVSLVSGIFYPLKKQGKRVTRARLICVNSIERGKYDISKNNCATAVTNPPLVIVSFSENRKWRLLTDHSAIVNLKLLSRVTL